MSREEEFRAYVAEHWEELVEAAEAPASRANEVWLTRGELADRWKLPLATLNQWATKKRGPRYGSFGRHARYRLSDVILWENEQFDDEPPVDASVTEPIDASTTKPVQQEHQAQAP